MARWGRPLLRCTVSVVCAEGELTVGVFKTSDQIQKGPSAEQAHRQIILYISRYINIDSYCPCPVAWHAKHPFWRIDEPCTTPLLSSFDLNCSLSWIYIPSCTTSDWCSQEKKTSRHHFWSCTLPFPSLPS